jgi:hypothetical protein
MMEKKIFSFSSFFYVLGPRNFICDVVSYFWGNLQNLILADITFVILTIHRTETWLIQVLYI